MRSTRAGKPLRLVGAHTDISDRKAAEERLQFQAEHDPLTSLANRRLGFQKLDERSAVPVRTVTRCVSAFAIWTISKASMTRMATLVVTRS